MFFDNVATTTSWIAVNEGSAITSLPLYLGAIRSAQVLGGSAADSWSMRTSMPTSVSRCAMKYPFGSLVSASTLSKPCGLNGTNRPRRVMALAADMSDMVMTSTATRPASASCWKRRITFCPPVRSISTLMPVRFSNSLAIYWPAATGVDVYQVTLPSRLAAASSTGSDLNSCLTSCADTAPIQRLAINAAHIRVMASSQQRYFVNHSGC